MNTNNTIYSTGWGNRPITVKNSSRVFTITPEGWFNLSRWVYTPLDEAHELDRLVGLLFHENHDMRNSIELELANVLRKSTISTVEMIRADTDGPIYNGPRIMRRFTPRISLRELTIIMVEHRARVEEWKHKIRAHKAKNKASAQAVPVVPAPEPVKPALVLPDEPPDNWEDMC